MITLTNGLPQGPNGLIVPNGSIKFQLNIDATVIAAPGGFVAADIPVVFQFNAAGQIQPNPPAAAAQIYSNAELNPQNSIGLGTYYLVTFYDQNGAQLNMSPMWWQFYEAAGSTVDISQITPVSTVGGNVIFYPTPNFTNNIAWNDILPATGNMALNNGAFTTTITSSGLFDIEGPFQVDGPATFTEQITNVGALIISPTTISFAAPTVTPAVSGSSVWSYQVAAFRSNVLIALSAVGTTSVGTATLSGTDFNTVTWAAVPTADTYVVQMVASPAQNPEGIFTGAGIVAVLSAPTVTYNDVSGLPHYGAGNNAWLYGSESGFVGITTGLHIGPAFTAFSGAFPFTADLAAGSPLVVNSISSNSAIVGNLQVSGAQSGFPNYLATGYLALEVTAANTGLFTSALYVASDYTGSTGTQEFLFGIIASPTHSGSGALTNLGGYYCACNPYGTGALDTMFCFEADTPEPPGGTLATNIGVWINDQSGIATSNYGLKLDALTNVGAGNWAIYADNGIVDLGGNLSTQNRTAAISTVNRSSPTFTLGGHYWTGSVSAVDSWTLQDFLYLGAVYTLSAASNAAGGQTTYTGVFIPTLPVGTTLTIAGFSNAGNNGSFTVTDNRGNSLVVGNSGGVLESHVATATVTSGSGSALLFTHAGSSSRTQILIPNAFSNYPDLAFEGDTGLGFSNLGSSELQLSCGPSAAFLWTTNTFEVGVGDMCFGPAGVAMVSLHTDPTTTYALSAASNASAGNTTYTGVFSPVVPVGAKVNVGGFTNFGNNVTYGVTVSCNSTTLVVVNPNGVAETKVASVSTSNPCFFVGLGGSAVSGFTATLGVPPQGYDPPATGTWTSSQAGRLWFNTATSQLRYWDGVETASVPGTVATSHLTAQAAAISATTIYAVPAALGGLYEISWSATVTVVDGSSSTLGGATGFQAKYTNVNDSVVKTTNPTTATISAGNTTATSIGGTVVAYCKGGTNLQYLFGYTSNTPGQMNYDLNIYVRYLG